MQFPEPDARTGDGMGLTEDVDLTICPSKRVILHCFWIDRLYRHRGRLPSGHTG